MLVPYLDVTKFVVYVYPLSKIYLGNKGFLFKKYILLLFLNKFFSMVCLPSNNISNKIELINHFL
jgi:hypothetical protein